jgi:prepilin-type N-terminal cleavage/methylation domain-containing protein
MNPRRHPRSLGFTLIEVMAAVAILGLVVGAIYSSWMVIVHAARVGSEAAATAQRSRIAMSVMESALGAAQKFAANDSWYGFEAESGSSGRLSFVARLPASFPRSGRFGDLDIRRITFSVEAGAESGKQLVMRQSPLLMELDEDEQNYPLVLARNVRELRLEFWDTRKGWIDEWNPTRIDTNQLPKMVKIVLEFGTGGSYSGQTGEEIVRVVGLPSAGVLPFWQGQVPNPGSPAGVPPRGATNLPPNQFVPQPGMQPDPGTLPRPFTPLR